MTGRCVALLRGINVGSAKMVPMSDLARVFQTLGATDVKTVLRSGNVVFTGALSAEAVEDAVLAATGVQSRVLVLDAESFHRIAHANPLIDIITDGSKCFVTFLSERPTAFAEPDVQALAPERLVVGTAAVYQWIPAGSLLTKVPNSWWKQFAGHRTARNWNTVQKLLTLLES